MMLITYDDDDNTIQGPFSAPDNFDEQCSYLWDISKELVKVSLIKCTATVLKPEQLQLQRAPLH
jgi:hypothetical protein